ncbi:DUF397 domain-containing protein [Streptosporangium sp. NBC_01755]|uniref:DUF397 domain-containing protein n=1 Tax=Streptosporangium sp. NBC_01755 TaxID=2975949 RepID=UPI002DDA7E9B|nr:DUF397 domain-containing protein [Streptosporangium sp. NBC_01755]WSD01218.1 DUF397 domain-containing protein [Streptosporangium sp. NBC_01755]
MDLSKAQWRKSSLSGNNGGNCVEVAELGILTEGPAHKPGHPHLIAVRDSKDPHGPNLFFTPTEWTAFINGIKADDFDLG